MSEHDDSPEPKNIFEKLFGKAPDTGYEFVGLSFTLAHQAVVISWSCKGVGFGELDLLFTEKGLDMNTECMSNEFVLCALNETIKRIDQGQKATDFSFTAEGDMEGKDSQEGREPLIKVICQTFQFYVAQNYEEELKAKQNK